MSPLAILNGCRMLGRIAVLIFPQQIPLPLHRRTYHLSGDYGYPGIADDTKGICGWTAFWSYISSQRALTADHAFTSLPRRPFGDRAWLVRHQGDQAGRLYRDLSWPRHCGRGS